MTVQEFAQIIQKRTGQNIQFSPCTTVGQSHCPVVTINLDVPGLGTFTGSGPNQKIAKQDAVNKAVLSIKK